MLKTRIPYGFKATWIAVYPVSPNSLFNCQRPCVLKRYNLSYTPSLVNIFLPFFSQKDFSFVSTYSIDLLVPVLLGQKDTSTYLFVSTQADGKELFVALCPLRRDKKRVVYKDPLGVNDKIFIFSYFYISY